MGGRMSEFKRIKNKITKRHYTGILKGEALYLVKTIERLIPAANRSMIQDMGLEKEWNEINFEEERKYHESTNTTGNFERL
jgi:hypothetical protein